MDKKLIVIVLTQALSLWIHDHEKKNGLTKEDNNWLYGEHYQTAMKLKDFIGGLYEDMNIH